MTIQKVQPDLRIGSNIQHSVLLTNTVNSLIEGVEKQIGKDVVSPYTLVQEDSGSLLVFNEATDAIINIPDDLDRFTSFMSLNLGTGSVTNVLGTDNIRGSLVLSNADSFISMTKVGNTIWQSSEVV